MKERTCSVLPFLSCTTAPAIGLSCASVTVPCTIRSLSSSDLFFWCEKPAEAKHIRSSAATVIRRIILNAPFAFCFVRRTFPANGYAVWDELLPLFLFLVLFVLIFL